MPKANLIVLLQIWWLLRWCSFSHGGFFCRATKATSSLAWLQCIVPIMNRFLEFQEFKKFYLWEPMATFIVLLQIWWLTNLCFGNPFLFGECKTFGPDTTFHFTFHFTFQFTFFPKCFSFPKMKLDFQSIDCELKSWVQIFTLKVSIIHTGIYIGSS